VSAARFGWQLSEKKPGANTPGFFMFVWPHTRCEDGRSDAGRLLAPGASPISAQNRGVTGTAAI
jgi:hypothetical protein